MPHESPANGAQDVIGKVDALLNPRNVVIVGATDKLGNWPQRVWRNLTRFGYPKPIYPFNPLLPLLRGAAGTSGSPDRARAGKVCGDNLARRGGGWGAQRDGHDLGL